MKASPCGEHSTLTGDDNDEERELRELLVWMRRQASKRLRDCPPDFTLQTTALVNEAILRIMRNSTLHAPPNRAYLFSAAAQAVREALANAVRKRLTERSGAGLDRVSMVDTPGGQVDYTADLLDLHQAVEALKLLQPRQALVVDLKFYAAMTIAEISETLGLADWTVENDWRLARKFLKDYLTP